MAPEVIMGEGYSFAVDYWSIGICLFEFVVGEVPFGENSTDPIDIYKEIIFSELRFPNLQVDKNFMDFVSQVLHKNPLARLYNFTQIKNHPWLCDFDWKALNTFSVAPPYIPVKSGTETILETTSLPSILDIIKAEKVSQQKEGLDILSQKKFDKWFHDF